MKVTPVRQPLAEVAWHARNDMPVVIWGEKEQRWVVVTFAGWFRLRIADGDHPTHRVSLSRGELVHLLGLKSGNEVVEAGIVHPERPAHAMSVHADPGHHEPVSPERRFFRLLKAERQDISRASGSNLLSMVQAPASRPSSWASTASHSACSANRCVSLTRGQRGCATRISRSVSDRTARSAAS